MSERNSITHSTEEVETNQEDSLKVPGGCRTKRRQDFPFCVRRGRESRTAFAQKADGSHFALTVPFQAGSIAFEASPAAPDKSNVSIHAIPTEDGARMTSVDGVMVFIIYH